MADNKLSTALGKPGSASPVTRRTVFALAIGLISSPATTPKPEASRRPSTFPIRLLCSPAFLQRCDDCCPASRTQFSFAFRRRWLCRRRISRLGLRPIPSPTLGVAHSVPGAGRHLPSCLCDRPGCGRRLVGFVRHHRPQFGDPAVNKKLLLLKALYSGAENVGAEFRIGHV